MAYFEQGLLLFSVGSSVVSFLTRFVSLVPQIMETYSDKSVEALSPTFLMCWVFGDISTLVGAVLTNQLLFEILQPVYFLFTDLIMCLQYYYYGIYYRNIYAKASQSPDTLEDHINIISSSESSIFTPVGESSRLRNLIVFFLQAVHSQALPFFIKETKPVIESTIKHSLSYTFAAVVLSWIGAFFYIGGRVPQLVKNYLRQSTDGLSPWLYACTLTTNITYALSIFTSPEFFFSTEKVQYFLRVLPFLVGSLGTVIFDLIYFYQHYVLYYCDLQSPKVEFEVMEPNEITPLLGDKSL